MDTDAAIKRSTKSIATVGAGVEQKGKKKQERARAVLLRENHILLLRKERLDQLYHIFPGGGIEQTDESPEAGVKRECREELGVDVVILTKLHEGFCTNPWSEGITHFFLCEVKEGEPALMPLDEFAGPDLRCTLQWVSLEEVEALDIRPTEHRTRILEALFLACGNSNPSTLSPLELEHY